jgi:hypothetical protein
VVFDLKTYTVLGKLAAMPDADGIIYDAKQNKVLAVSGDGNALLTFAPEIDPASGKIDPPIQLGGAPEFLATDGSGKVFINLEDKDVVAVVDLATRSVVARWPVAPAGHPVGMSMDTAGHHLFIGCRNPQRLVVMNSETGKVDAALPIGAGVDATAYGAGEVFASARLSSSPARPPGDLPGQRQGIERLEEDGGHAQTGEAALVHALHLGGQQQHGDAFAMDRIQCCIWRKVVGPSIPGIITSIRMACGRCSDRLRPGSRQLRSRRS